MVNLEFLRRKNFTITNIFQENLISTSNSSIIMTDFQDSKLITKGQDKSVKVLPPSKKTEKTTKKFPGCFWSAKGPSMLPYFEVALLTRLAICRCLTDLVDLLFGFQMTIWQWSVNKDHVDDIPSKWPAVGSSRLDPIGIENHQFFPVIVTCWQQTLHIIHPNHTKRSCLCVYWRHPKIMVPPNDHRWSAGPHAYVFLWNHSLYYREPTSNLKNNHPFQ